MAWYLAKSLQTLRRQANTLAPNRSKVADGTIGDTAHSSRTSDHNPTSSGQVCALDLTHDPAGGLDAHDLAEQLLRAQDPRLKYVISRSRIGSGPGGPSPGVWRRFDGENPHDKHAHISVRAGSLGDQTHPWQTAALAATEEDDLTPHESRLLTDLHEGVLPMLRQVHAWAGETHAKVIQLQQAVPAAVKAAAADADLELSDEQLDRFTAGVVAQLAERTGQ